MAWDASCQRENGVQRIDTLSDTVQNPGEKTVERTKSDDETQTPKLFKVLLHNDHYTTMEFVVDVLSNIFSRTIQDAVRIMLSVHEAGIGVAGVYPASVAETKVAQVAALARDQGFPLKCSMEPE